MDDIILTHTAVLSNDPATYFYALGNDSIIYENNSIQGVSDNPGSPTTIVISEPHMITGIFTYHWNAQSSGYIGQTIRLQHSDGTVYGPWDVSAANGSGGKPNVNWFTFPNEVLKPGTYTLIDSDNATWSWAYDTNNKGICIVKGIPMDSPLQAVSDFILDDAIAPINGGTPVTTVTETDEYTGTITWAGDPGTFSPGTSYTATITLTAKDGYTFDSIAENAFSVPCAKTATNPADSGVITATFISPPDEYITDGNGIMAYRYSNYYSPDIQGTYNGTWQQTTFGNGGYGTYFKFGNEAQSSINIVSSDPIDVGNNVTFKMEPKFYSDGRFIRIVYTLHNSGSETQTVSFGSHADTQIGNNDSAPITRFADGRGFKMVNTDDGAQFNFFGKETIGVTDVDTYWFGYWNDRHTNVFNQVAVDTFSGDSGMAYSWQNKTLAPGQTRTFSILIGVGDALSGENIPVGVNFDSQGGSDVDTVTVAMVGDTISAPTPPTRSGYTFGGWYKEPGCVNQFNFSTPITATITLYAKWTQNAPPSGGGGSYVPPKYSVTDANQGTQAGGQTKLSKERAEAGDTIVITLTPDKGYEGSVPDVLDKNNKPITVTDIGDGTYSFVMPAGKVTIDAKYSKISYFDDVSSRDWFDEASWFCAANGLMKGTGHKQFNGNIGSDRASLVTVLYRLAMSSDNYENIFSDVKSGKWYSEAIAWAAHNKIVEGYGGGLFGPEDILTREQMVSILYRYSVFMKYDVSKLHDLAAFGDADRISDWALEPMKWAVANNVVEGVGNGLISPDTGATRAQFAAMIQRYATTIVK